MSEIQHASSTPPYIDDFLKKNGMYIYSRPKFKNYIVCKTIGYLKGKKRLIRG